MQFATVNGLTLHYRVEGPPSTKSLVFINSLGTDLCIWEGVVSQFAADHTIIRYDKPGHGLSDTPAGTYTVHHHAETLLALLDVLNISTAVFIGISMGGQVAQDIAIHHPDRVQALVLCDTAAKLGSSEAWNQRIAGVREKGMRGMAKAILDRWFAPSYAQQHRTDYAGYHNMLVRMPDDGYISACKAIRDADMRDQVSNIQVPALVICGAEDAATPPDVVRGLADALPRSQFELIAGAGHLPCIEQPSAVASLIKNFLKDNKL
ncbi:MAG: 3-oxoadipate enol-lactonase [Chloroflexi bacterium]|nr:3-oxoadipate enol-lactonase [Chloroflexota bacterium]